MITIRGVGPTRDTFPFSAGHSAIGRITAVALAPNGTRMYAGSFAGVWRSDDAGRTWVQLTWPQPPFGTVDVDIVGALFPPDIFDIAVSPSDSNLVLISGLDSQFKDQRDGIYRSTDGGANWKLVLQTSLPCSIAFAPDNAKLVFAAIGGGIAVSQDGGEHWTIKPFSPAWHVAVAPLEPSGKRRVYAVGDSTIWHSTDGGNTWRQDNGAATINASRQAINVKRK